MKTKLLLPVMLVMALSVLAEPEPIPVGEKGVLGKGKTSADGHFTLEAAPEPASRAAVQQKTFSLKGQESREHTKADKRIVGKDHPKLKEKQRLRKADKDKVR